MQVFSQMRFLLSDGLACVKLKENSPAQHPTLTSHQEQGGFEKWVWHRLPGILVCLPLSV